MLTPPKTWLSAVLALPLGLLYVTVNPPFTINDEADHFARAYELSRGILVPRSDPPESRYLEIPAEWQDEAKRYERIPEQPDERIDASSDAHGAPATGELARRPAPSRAYSPVAYLPQVPCFWLGRLLSLRPVTQLYVARVAGLLTYSLFTSVAVAWSGPFGWALLAVGLMPMAVTQAAGLTVDGLTNALAFLFFAWLIRMSRASSKVSYATYAFPVGLVWLLACCKPPYLMLALAIPPWPRDSASPRPASPVPALLALSGGALLVASWAWAYPPLLSPLDGGHWLGRLWTLLAHPWSTLKLARKTLFRHGDEYLIQLVALRTYLDEQMRFLGSVIASAYMLLLVFLSRGALHVDLKPSRSVFARRIALGTACGILSVFFAFYVLANPPEIRVLEGVQGRYFLPLLPGIFLVLASARSPVASSWLTRKPGVRIVLPIVALNLLCLLGLYARYYTSAKLDLPY